MGIVSPLLTAITCFFVVRHLLLFRTESRQKAELEYHRIAQLTLWAISAAMCGVTFIFEIWPLLPLAPLPPLVPFLKQRSQEKRYKKFMYQQMDSMLASLSNAVSVSGNIYNAIEDVIDGEPEPMRLELKRVVHEIKLGITEDEALQRLAQRSGLPLFKTAITAIIVAKSSGGDVGHILAHTAGSIRELKRLDGVLQTKTADARTQAWVMGLIPFFLCGILQLIDPDWLTPVWTTPFGWFLLCCAVVMEFFAVVLIRKILRVAL